MVCEEQIFHKHKYFLYLFIYHTEIVESQERGLEKPTRGLDVHFWSMTLLIEIWSTCS